MSSNYFSPLLLLAFLLFVAAASSAAGKGGKVVVVSDICELTNSPLFCLTLLNSNRKGNDLVSLARYTIDIDRANVTNTITLIKSLIAETGVRDPKANAHYKICLHYFTADGGALSAIEHIQESLNKGDYDGVKISAGTVYRIVDACISGSRSPFPDTSSLPKYAHDIQQVTDIIAAIASLLK